MDGTSEIRHGASLEVACAQVESLAAIRKEQLRAGDRLFVRTWNSHYLIRVLDDDHFEVSGGWFDRKGVSPFFTSINGCTWGGTFIKVDIIAACGLCIEFGNRVTTSVVRHITVIPRQTSN